MKNILIVSSSFRKNGNSEMLVKEFEKGAKEAGNAVEVVSLRDLNIGFCRGCLACQKSGKCVIRDDAEALAEKMKNANALVFATPVYYYSVSGQLKTMLDRMNPIYGSDYKFTDVYLLATAAEDEESAVEGTVTAVQGWIDCFDRANLKAVVFAGGVNGVGDIAGHKKLAMAYETGKRV